MVPEERDEPPGLAFRRLPGSSLLSVLPVRPFDHGSPGITEDLAHESDRTQSTTNLAAGPALQDPLYSYVHFLKKPRRDLRHPSAIA